MNERVLILGGGMIGSAMALDLSRHGVAVCVADVREETRARLAQQLEIETVAADLSNPAAIQDLVRGYHVVIGALPSLLGLQTLRAVIEAGRNYVDISFMPEDALALAPLARERGVTAVVDCGVAPGISNMMAGYATTVLDPCEELEIYVGGLPAERRWPFEYKAGFAPHDVIEEYVRPSRIVEHGRVVVRPALSEPERIDFPGVGTLEAFNTDGLRSLAETLRVPFMKEKTLRYPGHIETMRILRELGLFSKSPLVVAGQAVRPFDVTAALLFPMWQFEPGEADLTVLRVRARGRRDGVPTEYGWDMLDRYDPATGLRSMSRTTGFPATIVAGLLASGGFDRPGVHAPEALGMQPGLLDFVLRELEARGVSCQASVTPLPPV